MNKAAKKCTHDGCGRVVLARGLCSAHYQRWYKAHRHRPTKTTNKAKRRPPCGHLQYLRWVTS